MSRAYSQSAFSSEARLDRPKQRARTAADEVRRDHTSDGTWRLLGGIEHGRPEQAALFVVHCAMCSGKGTRAGHGQSMGMGMMRGRFAERKKMSNCNLLGVLSASFPLRVCDSAPSAAQVRRCGLFLLPRCIFEARIARTGPGFELQFAIRNTSCNPIGSCVRKCSAVAAHWSAVCLSAESVSMSPCLQPLCLVPSVSLP